MSKFTSVIAIAFGALGLIEARAGTISVVPNYPLGYFDVFLQPTAGSEFLTFELRVGPFEGGIRDPVRNVPGSAGNYDDVTDGARYDTWANTPLSSLGAGPPEYYFIEYHPGQPPFNQPTDLPRRGGNPNELWWFVLDFRTGDGPANEPFHMARILVARDSGGDSYLDVYVKATDTVNGRTGGDQFSTGLGGFLPEPTTALLAGVALLGWISIARRRR